MLTARWANGWPWSGVLLALLVGIVARDCILIASAALLAIYVARTRLHDREAVDLMRCAMHCWLVGAASMLIGFALLAMVVGMRAELWEGNHLDLNLLMVVVGACSLIVSVSNRADVARGLGGRRSVVMATSMLLFVFFARSSFAAIGPCLFALCVAAVSALTGWQLARKYGAQLARAAAPR